MHWAALWRHNDVTCTEIALPPSRFGFLTSKTINLPSFIPYLRFCRMASKISPNRLDYIEGKLSAACGAIYRLREKVNQECLRSFYFAHIYFHLQYSILAWYNTQKCNLKRVESIHCKAVRLRDHTYMTSTRKGGRGVKPKRRRFWMVFLGGGRGVTS